MCYGLMLHTLENTATVHAKQWGKGAIISRLKSIKPLWPLPTDLEHFDLLSETLRGVASAWEH